VNSGEVAEPFPDPCRAARHRVAEAGRLRSSRRGRRRWAWPGTCPQRRSRRSSPPARPCCGPHRATRTHHRNGAARPARAGRAPWSRRRPPRPPGRTRRRSHRIGQPPPGCRAGSATGRQYRIATGHHARSASRASSRWTAIGGPTPGQTSARTTMLSAWHRPPAGASVPRRGYGTSARPPRPARRTRVCRWPGRTGRLEWRHRLCAAGPPGGRPSPAGAGPPRLSGPRCRRRPPARDDYCSWRQACGRHVLLSHGGPQGEQDRRLRPWRGRPMNFSVIHAS
jgi:hypothetical protein